MQAKRNKITALIIFTGVFLSTLALSPISGEENEWLERPAENPPENLRYYLLNMEEGDEIDREIEKYFGQLKTQQDLKVDSSKVEDIVDSDADKADDFYSESSDETDGRYTFANVGDSNESGPSDILRHTVEKGDTIWSISRKYDVKPEVILEHNPEFKDRPLYIGEEVLIYSNPHNQSGKVVIERKVYYHKVRRGETLSHIALKYDTSVKNLARWNGIGNKSMIRVGQTVKIVKRRKKLPEGYEYSTVFIWPVKGRISSRFGRRRNPFVRGRRSYHKGLDIAGKMGTRIKAARDGLVFLSGRMGGYGNVVFIRHAGGYVTVYGHNKVNYVKKGDVVKQGDVIAELGRTGTATGPHLHFEVRKETRPINPFTAFDLREIVPVASKKVTASRVP